jgi:diguanylate cyclase (GGDEF)-like protein/PAS domain S-box-containing protein
MQKCTYQWEDVVARSAIHGDTGRIVVDDKGHIVWANEAAHSLLDPLDCDVTAKPALAWIAQSDALQEINRTDGTTFWALVTQNSTGDGHQIFHIQPADAVGQQFEALAYSESLWRNAVEASEHGVWDYNDKNQAHFHSPSWKVMRGFDPDRPVEDSLEIWAERLHPDDRQAVLELTARHNSGEVQAFNFEYRERRTDGEYVWILARGRALEWDERGRPTRLMGTDTDITAIKLQEKRRREELEALHQSHVAELEAEHHKTEAARKVAHVLARQDPLTQLPNRRVFNEEIERLLTSSATPKPFAVMLIDLDHFKPVNDLYGHMTGDHIVNEAAQRLMTVCASNGTLARLGGDEFGIIIEAETVSDLEKMAEFIAKYVIGSMSEPIPLGEFQVEVGATVGIAIYPKHGSDAELLFRNADLTLYEMKKRGRGRHGFYEDNIGKETEARAILEAETRQAVLHDEIEPFYQPIMDLRSGEISSVEVLARWNSQKLGAVPPDKFISIIEQYNLMPQFTLSMLRQTCMSARSWPATVGFAINLTPKEVCDLTTPMKMLDILTDYEISPSRLRVEVTEEALMTDLFTAKQVIAAFRNAGAQVMLDDFGSGYAGLGYLRELKFDSIKIDRSFIMTMMRQDESAKIVWIMQTLADALGLKTVAEGIEDQRTLEAVRSIGCTYGQGYHFSRAVPARDLHKLFKPQFNTKGRPHLRAIA